MKRHTKRHVNVWLSIALADSLLDNNFCAVTALKYACLQSLKNQHLTSARCKCGTAHFTVCIINCKLAMCSPVPADNNLLSASNLELGTSQGFLGLHTHCNKCNEISRLLHVKERAVCTDSTTEFVRKRSDMEKLVYSS